MDSGLYVAVFRLGQPHEIGVGRLGRRCFPAGFYLYVGSAQRNLSARLGRHANNGKALRWHVDYLSVAAEVVGAMIVTGSKMRECELARQLAAVFVAPITGFGSSDCRCSSHLFYSEDLAEV
jgi:sugar fermentation stimulation protein A